MSEFKLGDLVQFIPENFDRIRWPYCYVGVGFIDDITEVILVSGKTKVYSIFCGKVIRQQMNNFAEIELKNKVVELSEKDMYTLCRHAKLDNLSDI